MLFVGYGLEWIVSAFCAAPYTDQVREWLRVYRTSLPFPGRPAVLI